MFVETPVGGLVGVAHCGFEVFRQFIIGSECARLVVGNGNAVDMTAADNRPAGVAPVAQALQRIGRYDVLVSNDPVICFLMTGAFLLRDAKTFATGSRLLVRGAASIPV